LAASALEELNRLAVTVKLDTARFRSVKIPPPAARLTIERQGDLIEAYLIGRKLAGTHAVEDGPRPIQP
jgi:hypothetical protein